MFLSLLIVVICVFSCVYKVLFIMPPHILPPYVLYSMFISCLWPPLLFTPSLCLRKSVCWIGLVAYSSHSHICHLILCLWLIVVSIFSSFCSLFSLSWFIGVYGSLFSAQQPKTNSPSLMYNKVIIIGKHGICSLIVLPGRWVGCQSFLIPN